MEPLLGGKLANSPKPIQEIFDTNKKKRAPYDWALQWLWNQPEVSVVLSGMSNMEQVQGNLKAAEASGVNSLTNEELEIVERVEKKYREMVKIPCTKCGYCMPCPNNVNIPRNFDLFNNGFMHDNVEASRAIYKRLGSMPQGKELASSCIGCKVCEDKCPQRIEISQWMVKVHEVLGEEKK